jgi:hypothetical protein
MTPDLHLQMGSSMMLLQVRAGTLRWWSVCNSIQAHSSCKRLIRSRLSIDRLRCKGLAVKRQQDTCYLSDTHMELEWQLSGHLGNSSLQRTGQCQLLLLYPDNI